jgi:hypothetical protein
MTGAQMCELIAAHWRWQASAGIADPPSWWNGTPEGIWTYSPTGELTHISAWFEQAQFDAARLALAL